LAYPVQSIRPLGAKFYPLRCDAKGVVLSILSSYLGAQQGRRNEAALTI